MSGKKFKDFDKDKMYSKIMPTTAPPPKWAAATEDDEWWEEGEYLCKNLMEDVVREKLDHTIQVLKACNCEKCKKDVMALALGELPTAYKTIYFDEMDETVKRLRGRYEVKVTAALIKAIQTVKTNPRHH